MPAIVQNGPLPNDTRSRRYGLQHIRFPQGPDESPPSALQRLRRIEDKFNKRRLDLVTGLGTVFCLQTLLIIGGVTRLIPLTGVTLPFMSYGGSSLLANFVMIALLLRVSDDLATQNRAVGWTPGYDPLVDVGPAGGGR